MAWDLAGGVEVQVCCAVHGGNALGVVGQCQCCMMHSHPRPSAAHMQRCSLHEKLRPCLMFPWGSQTQAWLASMWNWAWHLELNASSHAEQV